MRVLMASTNRCQGRGRGGARAGCRAIRDGCGEDQDSDSVNKARGTAPCGITGRLNALAQGRDHGEIAATLVFGERPLRLVPQETRFRLSSRFFPFFAVTACNAYHLSVRVLGRVTVCPKAGRLCPLCGGDWGPVAPAVFKTVVPLNGGGWVRLPFTSAICVCGKTQPVRPPMSLTQQPSTV